MELKIEGIEDGTWIPERFAFGIADATQHMRFGENRNPGIVWSGEPAGTRSLVLICHDDDVPARADDVNQPGRTIAQNFPRTRFYHWVIVDIPSAIEHIAEASASKGVTPGGKRDPAGPAGSRQGLNSFTGFLQGNPDMAGKYFGYDGPCPPWNDERLHRYHFTLYATDLKSFPLTGEFAGSAAETALEGHVLASARVSGLYSLHPPLLEQRR
ncbi:MAG: YbhB/YbcL family Raf kinase inhibitor-like protein [Gammaproteobacteria bacterium]